MPSPRALLASVRAKLPKEAWILLIGAAAVGALLAFVLLAGEVSEGDTKAFDELVLTALRRPQDRAVPIGPLWLEAVALDLTALGSAAVLITIVLAVLGHLALERQRALLVETLVATAGGWLLNAGLKALFGRVRPTIVPQLQHVSSASFPSGHSMLSAIVYLTLGAMLARSTADRALRVYYLVVAMALTFVVGSTRIYLGVHYPTDVIGGWLAGFAWATSCALIARLLERLARG
jgi:undecaprenyl-diphosphatase